jgi:hypothetical protein
MCRKCQTFTFGIEQSGHQSTARADRPSASASQFGGVVRLPNRSSTGGRMAATSLNIHLIDKRMYREAEAAEYTGVPHKSFRVFCPVQPVRMTPKLLLWDKRDLDLWIDGLKAEAANHSHDDIVGRL